MPRLLPSLLLLLLVSALGCADDDGNGDPFDGNYIVGDASPLDPTDAGPRDLAPADALSDTGTSTSTPDAGAADGEVQDSEPADLGADPCAATPELTLTASAAVAQGAALSGRVVAVNGQLEAGPPTCTERACPTEEPCCNGCTAELLIDGLLPASPSECLPIVGCTGDECGLVCRPAALGTPETFVGYLRQSAGGSVRLELIRLRRR